MKRRGDTQTGLRHIFNETGDTLDWLLFDFDIDDATLKSKHRAVLDEALDFMARNLGRQKAARPLDVAWRVSLDGFASHTGTRQHNITLSASREQAVAEFLSRGTQFRHPELFEEVDFDLKFHGFDETPMPGQDARAVGENSLRRSVRLVVHPPDRKPLPRPLPPIETGSTKFQVRFRGSLSGGFGLIAEGALLEIVDLQHNMSGFFLFVAGGFSPPVPKVPPGSFSTPGPIRKFETTKPVDLHDFEGRAAYGTLAAVGPLSTDSELSIQSPAFAQKRARTLPNPIRFSTGVTVGVTLFSVTGGLLVLDKVGPG